MRFECWSAALHFAYTAVLQLNRIEEGFVPHRVSSSPDGTVTAMTRMNSLITIHTISSFLKDNCPTS